MFLKKIDIFFPKKFSKNFSIEFSEIFRTFPGISRLILKLLQQTENSIEGFDIAVEENNNDGNERNNNQIRNDLLNHYFPQLLQ